MLIANERTRIMKTKTSGTWSYYHLFQMEGSDGARSRLNRMEKLAVKPDFFFPPSTLAVIICLGNHNKMSCAEICGVQKYFLWLLPFPSLS